MQPVSADGTCISSSSSAVVDGMSVVNQEQPHTTMSSESDIVSLVRDYVRFDNAKKTLTQEVKELKGPMKDLKESITRYMTVKNIAKIPIKRNGDEFLEVKVKVHTRKPTHDEMSHVLVELIRSNEVLNKSPQSIIELLTTPIEEEEEYELCRRCKRKHTAKKGSITSTASDEASMQSMRDLLQQLQQSASIERQQRQQEGEDAGGSVESIPNKRQRIQGTQ